MGDRQGKPAELYAQRIEGGKAENLEHSLLAYGEALRVFTREAMPFQWAFTLSNLAQAYVDRFELTGQENDLERAISHCERALIVRTREAMPRDWATIQGILGYAYSRRRGPRKDNLELAITACQRALSVRTLAASASLHRISANLLGKLCAEAGRWSEAADAFHSAIAATEQLYKSSLFRSSEQVELGQSGHLHRLAAEALARLGRPREAVTIAERGRARGLGEALNRHRLDLTEVKNADPWAYDLYHKALGSLRWLEGQKRSEGSSSAGGGALRGEALRQKMRAVRDDLDRAIARIRCFEGNRDLLREPDFNDIAATVLPGKPLVYLLPLESQTLVLLVSRQTGSETPRVEVLWLASLSRSEDDRGGELPLPPPGQGPEAIRQIMNLLRTTVGEGILRPLADRLRALSATGVILIPGWMLGAIYPLHAIPYTRERRTSCLLDEFDVTYAPSARVLRVTRRSLEVRCRRRPILVGVGNPDTDGADPLPYAKAEVEMVSDHFDQSYVLCGHEATLEAFFAKLPEADYIHLACHGQYDPETTMAAQLMLTGQQTLRLRTLLDLRPFKHNRLVVLSACTSGTSQPFQIADEMVGLPAGFLEAGAPGVVGALWTVNDLSTALLMTRFYGYHLRGDPARDIAPLPPPAALRRAQLWLRDITAGELLTLFDQQQALRGDDRQTAQRGLSEELAAAGAAQLLLEDPAARPFASPYYWAPFLFLGA